MRRNSLLRVVMWCTCALLIVTLVYLMLDVGSAGEVLVQYDSLKPDLSSSFSKKTIFLTSYVRTTGDLSVGYAAGLTEEDMQSIYNPPNVETPVEGGGQGGGISSGKTESGWKSALASCGNPSYYSLGAGYKLVEHNGSQFLVEVQGNSYFSNLRNGSEDTIDSVGCWLFAQANAANALNNSTYSVKDILQVRWNCSIPWNGSTNMWINPTVNYTGGMSCAQRVVSEEKDVFDYLKVKASLLSSGNCTAQAAYDKIKNSGFDNCVYIVYGHASGILSSGDNHWLVVVGLTEDSFQFLGNGRRKSVVPISDLGGRAGAFTTIIKVYK